MNSLPIALYILPQTIETRHNREPRNFAPQRHSASIGESKLSVFTSSARRLYESGGKRKRLSEEERHKAYSYILLNCRELSGYICEFDRVAPMLYPNELVVGLRDKYFAKWFQHKVRYDSFDGSARHLEVLASYPSTYAHFHNGYFVNGYKFHTQKHGEGRVTSNSGVCVRGEMYNAEESDYYGLLDEILEIEYFDSGPLVVVLFKCTWFDNIKGVIVNKNNLVDVKYKSRLPTNDPFCLASQAEQVFYAEYPADIRD